MADYGFDPTLPPDIDAGARALKTREMVAQMLMKQGMTQPQGKMVGRFYVAPSPLQNIGNAATMYAGVKGMQDADTAAGELGTKYREGVTNALSNYQQTKSGTPGSEIAWNQPTRPDGTGDASTSVPAVAANPRKAVIDAMTSQYGPVRDLGKLDYAQMAKAPEKYDLGDRIALMKDGALVGQLPKAAKPDTVLTETGADRRFAGVSGNTAATIAGANERHATPSGSAVLASNTTERGQDMTDSRQREANAVAAKSAQLKQSDLENKLKQQGVANAGAVASYQTALETLDRLDKHPGLSTSVGATLQPRIPFYGEIPGTEKANFVAELDTFKSQTFLPMVQSLRGMGALSDAEGKKLTAAVGALDTSMTEKAFKEHIGIIRRDLEAARQRVTGAGPAPVQPSAEIEDILKKYQ